MKTNKKQKDSGLHVLRSEIEDHPLFTRMINSDDPIYYGLQDKYCRLTPVKHCHTVDDWMQLKAGLDEMQSKLNDTVPVAVSRLVEVDSEDIVVELAAADTREEGDSANPTIDELEAMIVEAEKAPDKVEIVLPDPTPNTTPDDTKTLLKRLSEIATLAGLDEYTAAIDGEYEAISLKLAGVDVLAVDRMAERCNNNTYRLAQQRADLMRLFNYHKQHGLHLAVEHSTLNDFFNAEYYNRGLAQAVAELEWTREIKCKNMGIPRHIQKYMLMQYSDAERKSRERDLKRRKDETATVKRENSELKTKAADVREHVRQYFKMHPMKNGIVIDPAQYMNVWLSSQIAGGSGERANSRKLAAPYRHYCEHFSTETGALTQQSFKLRLSQLDKIVGSI